MQIFWIEKNFSKYELWMEQLSNETLFSALLLIAS